MAIPRYRATYGKDFPYVEVFPNMGSLPTYGGEFPFMGHSPYTVARFKNCSTELGVRIAQACAWITVAGEFSLSLTWEVHDFTTPYIEFDMC